MSTKQVNLEYLQNVLPIIPRSPISLKLMARNVLVKDRSSENWKEFCSYPIEVRDALIHPHMVDILRPRHFSTNNGIQSNRHR